MRDEEAREARINVWFTISGQFSPEELTRVTGLTPDSIGIAGELVHQGSTYRRKESSWDLRSSAAGSLPLEEHLKNIIERMEPSWQRFVEIGTTYQLGFGCGVHIYQAQGPELYVEPALVRKIAELGGYFDLDVYCLIGDDNGDEAC